jgi:hypothetical protein
VHHGDPLERDAVHHGDPSERDAVHHGDPLERDAVHFGDASESRSHLLHRRYRRTVRTRVTRRCRRTVPVRTRVTKVAKSVCYSPNTSHVTFPRGDIQETQFFLFTPSIKQSNKHTLTKNENYMPDQS